MVDTATRNERLCNGDYDFLVTASPLDVFPQESAPRFATTNPCTEVRTSDTKLDDYFNRLSATADPAEQVRLAREVERYILLEQAYKVVLWQPLAVQAYRSYVKGVITPAQGAMHHLAYETAWLDK